MELLHAIQIQLVDWQGVWSALMGHIGSRGWGCTTTQATGNVHYGSRANPNELMVQSIYSLLATT